MNMEREERMKVETVDICTCGIVMHQCNPDDYDTLGSDRPVCCPDCGNENFQTINQLQAENKLLKELLKGISAWMSIASIEERGTIDGLQNRLSKFAEKIEQALKGERR